MSDDVPAKDPLHGITLETIVRSLAEWYGWKELGTRIEIRCFTHDPSVKSSLKFLRKTPWARTKVEHLYIRHTDRYGQAPAPKEKPTETPTAD